MGIEALTVALDGTTVIPTSDDDWDDWVSATALRGYLSGDTLTDWLARYGEDHGFVRDERHAGYDERLEFPPFIMSKGGEFEQAIAHYLGQQAPIPSIGDGREAIRSLENAERTFEALSAGQQIVHQGILRDSDTRTYGAADFLIRSDVFANLFPGTLTAARVNSGAPGLDADGCRRVRSGTGVVHRVQGSALCLQPCTRPTSRATVQTPRSSWDGAGDRPSVGRRCVAQTPWSASDGRHSRYRRCLSSGPRAAGPLGD